MVTIIINRLKDWYERQLLDQQQGFRSARGTTDGIFTAKSIQQITAKMKKPTPVLFVDLSAAFDHVERNWLFKTIEKRFPNGSGNKLVLILKAIYSYTTTSLAENPDDNFELTVGVRQGGPESPMLYNLFMDFLMRIYLEECKKKGIKFLKLKNTKYLHPQAIQARMQLVTSPLIGVDMQMTYWYLMMKTVCVWGLSC